jgi:ribosomal protein S18 acetylase RimI-like enzyme
MQEGKQTKLDELLKNSPPKSYESKEEVLQELRKLLQILTVLSLLVITCILPDKLDIVSIAIDPAYRCKGLGRSRSAIDA